MASFDREINKSPDNDKSNRKSLKNDLQEHNDSGIINTSYKKSKGTNGELSFLQKNNESSDHKNLDHLILNGTDGKISKLELECKGEDTWLKNSEDYNLLYTFVKNWEENNQDYISEFSCSHSDNSNSRVCDTDNKRNCPTSPRSGDCNEANEENNNEPLDIMGQSGYKDNESVHNENNANNDVIENIVHYECTNNGKKIYKNDFLSEKYGEESGDTEIDENYDEVLFYYSSNKEKIICDHEEKLKLGIRIKSNKFFSKNNHLEDRYKSSTSNKVSNYFLIDFY